MIKWKVLSLVVIGFCLYAISLNAPFIFDDLLGIVQNYKLRNFQEFNNFYYWLNFNIRPLANFSFAVNYHFGELNPWGYRLVNIIIHILNSIIVLAIITILPINKKTKELSFVAALIFLVHPLATQGVTYTIQRMTSLAALFYFSAIFAFVKLRLSKTALNGAIWAAILFFATLFSLWSKQIGATIPLMILVAELLFFKSKKVVFTIIAFISLGTVSYFILYLNVNALNLNMGLEGIGRIDYFLTQVSAYWYYFIWIFYPLGQSLDPYLLIFNGDLSLQFILGLAVLGLFMLLAWLAYRKKSMFILFGLLWIPISMLVESSFIPIKDPLVAHRMYLPLFGVATLLASFLVRLQSKWLIIVVLCYFGLSTIYRNYQYNNPVQMWVDAEQKFPANPRPPYNIGYYALENGDTTKATQYFKKANMLDTCFAKPYAGLGLIALSKNNNREAIQLLHKATKYNSSDAESYLNIGVAWKNLGVYGQALKYFQKSVVLNPGLANGYYNLGVINEKINRNKEALANYKKCLTLTQNHFNARFNMANLYLKTSENEKAQKNYEILLVQSPQNAEVLVNLGVSYYNVGNIELARDLFEKALDNAPNNSQAKSNLEFLQRF